jgi:hypothetical protein
MVQPEKRKENVNRGNSLTKTDLQTRKQKQEQKKTNHKKYYTNKKVKSEISIKLIKTPTQHVEYNALAIKML